MTSQYKIVKLETAKSKIPQRACQKSGLLPKFPFSMLISGRSGSGKSNLLLNLLTDPPAPKGKKVPPRFLKGYFHYIVVFSPTAGEGDDMYDVLKLPPENFKADFTPEDLDELIASRKELIKKKGIEWVAKNSRVLIIMDDIIADRNFLMSPAALKTFALLRHYLCSVIILTQSYNKIPRSLRINCNATAVFPSTQSEIEVLLDEITPAGIKKRDFEKVIAFATDEPYTFLYINRHADKDKQIRKNLDEVIDLQPYKS